MHDMESLGKELLKGADTQRLRSIAESESGKKISRMIDQNELEQAAKTGDTAALQRILSQVLSTNEGKQLADQLSKAVQKK